MIRKYIRWSLIVLWPAFIWMFFAIYGGLTNTTFTLRAGKISPSLPEHVYVNYPVKINVNVLIDKAAPSSNLSAIIGTATFTFTNNTLRNSIKLYFPLLALNPCDPMRGYNDQVDETFMQKKTIILKQGESWSSKMPVVKLFDNKMLRNDNFSYGRYAFVFGAPEGEDPSKYLIGTILTEPIHYQLSKEAKDSIDKEPKQ